MKKAALASELKRPGSFLKHSATAAAAPGAGGGSGRAAAQGGLPQLDGDAPPHGVHGLQHLVEGDELFHPAEGQLGGDEGVGHPGGVAVLAGVLHQTAHRVASTHCSGVPPMSSTVAEAAMAAATPTSA